MPAHVAGITQVGHGVVLKVYDKGVSLPGAGCAVPYGRRPGKAKRPRKYHSVSLEELLVVGVGGKIGVAAYVVAV